MLIVLCSDPLQPRRPDQAYEAEVAAVEALGLTYSLVDYEALVDRRDSARAVRRVDPQPELTTGIYRGWMLRPEQYTQLYDALAEKGLQLINDPTAYKHCHYLPEWYPLLEGYTPRSAWLPVDGGFSIERVMALLRPFGSAPVIVKDYVKSRKHEWAEACYIPSADDEESVRRVVGRFLELQGEDLNEGLVFREFVQFEPVGTHPQSGMPLTREYRIFYLDREPLVTFQYWEEGDYSAILPPLDNFQPAADAVRSRFFTMDVARLLDGSWQIVEMGDAQVAGVPEMVDTRSLFRAFCGKDAGP